AAEAQAANAAAVVAVKSAEQARESANRQRSRDIEFDPDKNKPKRSGLKIGAVGLGAGTLAAYVEPGDAISFYEINPQVVDIADDKGNFTFLSDCKERGGRCDVKVGDARLVLERELIDGHPQHYDLLVLDAFSGDAIPAHLLTEEAFKIYEQHMASQKSDG